MSSHRFRAVPAAAVLIAALTLAACGGEAESAPDDGALRLSSAPAGAATAATGGPDSAAPVAADAVPESGSDAPVAARVPAAPAQERPRASVRTRTEPPEGPDPARPHPVDPSRFELAEPEAGAAFLAAGTRLVAAVETELSTDRHVAGDAFHAAVREDVLGANGIVLLPAGAVLNGRVVESRESTGADDPAVLRLDVESITVDGRTLPLFATVEELEVEADARDSGTTTATKVTAGAAAGAVIGRILGGDRRDAIKGAVAGAAAGTAVALATRDGHAVVRPGARLVVSLSERLVVEP